MKMNLLLINYSPERSEKEKDIVENTHIWKRQCRNYTHLKYFKDKVQQIELTGEKKILIFRLFLPLIFSWFQIPSMKYELELQENSKQNFRSSRSTDSNPWSVSQNMTNIHLQKEDVLMKSQIHFLCYNTI